MVYQHTLLSPRRDRIRLPVADLPNKRDATYTFRSITVVFSPRRESHLYRVSRLNLARRGSADRRGIRESFLSSLNERRNDDGRG